jgi:iron complex transport system substrate-binding protein
MTHPRILCMILAALAIPLAPAHAEIVLHDSSGATIRLAKPAQRIISLAPHISENLFAAGAGDRLVGAVDYSDFPEAANRVARVGGYSRPDLEAILALKPDLVLTWQSGNSAAVVAKLKALGLTVHQSQPDRLDDIPTNIETLGRMAGTEAIANTAASQFRQRLGTLRSRYAGRPRVSVFYQVWHQPLLTAGGTQIISDVITLCGGANIFAHLPEKAPAVSTEAVIAANPEAIVASGMGRDAPVGLERWRTWTRIQAVARNNLFFVPSDLMQRPTPRLLDGAEMLCKHLDTARGRR